jgi:hypothetical protein
MGKISLGMSLVNEEGETPLLPGGQNPLHRRWLKPHPSSQNELGKGLLIQSPLDGFYMISRRIYPMAIGIDLAL